MFNSLYEPIYKTTKQGSSAQSERKRLARNPLLKMSMKNRCQRQLETWDKCVDKPWNQVDRKTLSMLHLSLGTVGRRIVCNRNPHLKRDTMTTVERWRITKDAFNRPHNLILTGICSSHQNSQRESLWSISLAS